MKYKVLFGALAVLTLYFVYNWGYGNGLAAGVKATKS